VAPILLLSHSQQKYLGYCLPACAEMALNYLEISQSQEALAKKMNTTLNVGTLRSNIKKLASRHINVTYSEGTLADIRSWLDQEIPVIVFVEANELPVWRGQDFKHAVVVVSLDDKTIYLMDPALESGPTPTPLDDFQLAWDEMDNYYATLTRMK
jgi:ABC-type bacteriocin/lantibiotic exporter with double-glycine peptidase domain